MVSSPTLEHSWRYASVVSAGLLALSSVMFFVLENKVAGYGLVGFALTIAWLDSSRLGRDMSLIALGLVIMSGVSINTDISYSHMFEMGLAMSVIVALPYFISRYVFRDYAVHFPWHFKEKWNSFQWTYLLAVVAVGYLAIPFYMISTGVYSNWPAASDTSSVIRLFIGTNALGIWDELFFICTVFVLLKRHMSFWAANLLQAVLFTSFLYELGFEAWGPAMIYLFALVQGYIFSKTQSLIYIVTVHLTFDFLLFLVLLHAHNRSLFPVFFY